jgi:hypothetical protein
MKKKNLIAFGLLILLGGLSSCATSSTKYILATTESQVKLRAMQTRTFDTRNKTQMLRSVIATLQDLGFVIDKADEKLGVVSGTKLAWGMPLVLRMAVTVRPYGEKQVHVRATAQYGSRFVEDPEPYQQFFDALSKAVFLTAHEVD